MKKNLMVLSGLVLGLAPVVVLAQTLGPTATCAQIVAAGSAVGNRTIQTLICYAGNVLDTVIPILIILGIVYFVWGVISYVIGSDEEAKKKGRDRMIFGIIGLAVIVSMWGLVKILTKTFGLEENSPLNQGQAPGYPGSTTRP